MSPVRPDVLAVRSRREELVSRCIQAQRKHGMGMVTTEGYIVIATDEAGLPTKLRGHFIYGTATDYVVGNGAEQGAEGRN